MGLISSTHSMSRYHIEGSFEATVMDEVRNGLIQNAIPKIENEYEIDWEQIGLYYLEWHWQYPKYETIDLKTLKSWKGI